MAKEVLAVPEDHLFDVIRVIRAGLKQETERHAGIYANLQADKPLHPDVVEQLTKWCDEEAEYMAREFYDETQ